MDLTKELTKDFENPLPYRQYVWFPRCESYFKRSLGSAYYIFLAENLLPIKLGNKYNIYCISTLLCKDNVQYLAMFGCPVSIGRAVDICRAHVLSEFENQFYVQSDGIDFHLNHVILLQENSNINKQIMGEGRGRRFPGSTNGISLFIGFQETVRHNNCDGLPSHHSAN